MKGLLAFVCCILLAVPARGEGLSYHGVGMRGAWGGIQVASSCPYGTAYADGCAALAAAGHNGRYTFNGVNGLGAGNAFFTNTSVGARQSGQPSYKNASYSPSHPMGYNQAGADYGIGPWLPDGTDCSPPSTTLCLAYDPSYAPWVSTGYLNPTLYALGCTWLPANKYIRCNLSGSYAKFAPTAITGSINASGILTVASGTTPTAGTYVYYATAEAEPVVNTVVAPYLVSSVIDATHVQLAGSPTTLATQNLSWAALWDMSGYIFKDTPVFLGTGTGGVLHITNNEFLSGVVNTCSLGTQDYIDVSFGNTTGWFDNNYYGELSSPLGGTYCSTSASTYPSNGVAQATFNGTTTTQSPVFSATLSAGTMTVASATSGYISVGTILTGSGLPTGVNYVTAFKTGTKGGVGTYSVKTCTGGVTTSQSCVTTGTGGTITGGTNYQLAVNSLTTGTIYPNQYVNAAGFSSPVSYEILDTDGTNFYLAPTAAVPSLSNVTMTTGPTSSALNQIISVSSTAGIWEANYNYADDTTNVFAGDQTMSLSVSFNFLHQGVPRTEHGDPVSRLFPHAPTGAALGTAWDIQYFYQRFNTVYTDKFSASGQIYGGATGILPNGADTGVIAVFTNTGADAVNDYIVWGSWDFSNNILIANTSTNIYSGTASGTAGYLIYILQQGTYGYYPAVTGSWNMNNNLMDSVAGAGAGNAIYLGVCPTTTPGGSTHLSPTITGNVDMYTGLALNTPLKGGSSSCP